MLNIYEAETANKRKSGLVLVLFFLFVGLSVYFVTRAFAWYSGYETGGLGMAGIALIISGFMSFVGYYFSDKIVLGISQASEANRKKHFNFYTVTENLCLAKGLPKPRLFVINDSAPNAFATGRDPEHAVVCATTGLLEKLNRTELEGVIAHELSHIKNYDTRLMSVVSVMVGMVALLGDWLLRSGFGGRRSRDEDSGLGTIFFIVGLVFAIMSPIIGRLIQFAISRRREFMADAGSVMTTKQPEGLISALQKISADTEVLEAANKATAHLYISNPFKNKGHGSIDWFSNLFNTHPPVNERIKALKGML